MATEGHTSVSTLAQLYDELGRRGIPALKLDDGVLSMAADRGAWGGRLSVRWSASGLVTLELPLPFAVAPDRERPVLRAIASLNSGLRLPGFELTRRSLRFRTVAPIGAGPLSLRLLLDLAQTCIDTASSALPALAAAALGPQAEGPVRGWLEGSPSGPALQDRLADSLSDGLHGASRPVALDWDRLAVTGLLGRMAVDPFSAWLDDDRALVLVGDRCLGVGHGERAWALGDAAVESGGWAALDAALAIPTAKVLLRVGPGTSATEAALSQRGFELKDEQVLVERRLDAVPVPDEGLRLVPVVPTTPLPELARIVPELAATTCAGTWFVLQADGQVAGLALLRTDPVEGQGSLGFFGLAPAMRGRGLGRSCHRLVLFALRGLGCSSYRDATAATNLAMLRVFQANGCSVQGRVRWYGAPGPNE